MTFWIREGKLETCPNEVPHQTNMDDDVNCALNAVIHRQAMLFPPAATWGGGGRGSIDKVNTGLPRSLHSHILIFYVVCQKFWFSLPSATETIQERAQRCTTLSHSHPRSLHTRPRKSSHLASSRGKVYLANQAQRSSVEQHNAGDTSQTAQQECPITIVRLIDSFKQSQFTIMLIIYSKNIKYNEIFIDWPEHITSQQQSDRV